MTEKTTDFSFGYAELNQRGDHVKYLFGRDKDAFLSLGFSAGFETEFQSKVDESKAVETDEYWKGILSMKRDLVKTSRKAMLRSIDMFQLRLKLLLGGDSPEFKSFRFTGASKMKDDELVRYGRGLLQTAERFGDVISLAEGMQAFTEGLTEDCNDLDDAIDEVSQTIAQRDEASQKRARVGNELYAMITLVCDAGKRYWNGENEAYYNDYVIYGSSTPIAQPGEEEETPADDDATDTTSGEESQA